MNMNKKIGIFICLILSLFIFSYSRTINVYAESVTVVDCNSLHKKKDCLNASAKCRWISGSCQDQYLAQEPCNENSIRKVLKIFGYILMIAKFIVPLLIIGFGTFDLYKAVIDKDDKSLGKQLKRFGIRVVTGFLVFFVPNFVNAIFGMSDKTDVMETEQYKICVECLLDPLDDTTCNIK